MGDDRVYRSDVWNSGEGRVTEGNASNGDMDCLLVLAHSAELMSRCDGNFDAAIRINQNNEDNVSISKDLDGMQIAYVSDNDGNDLNCLNPIQPLPPCDSESLVQVSNEGHLVESLPGKKVRLTQIKRKARCKQGLREQQIVGECGGGYLRGKTIRLSELRRLARTKDAGILAHKLGLVNCHTSEDEQREHMMGKRRASEDCVFSEVDAIHEYDPWDEDNQCDGIDDKSQTPEEGYGETQITTHQIDLAVGKFREQKQMDQRLPSLELERFDCGSYARTETKTRSPKGNIRSINLKRTARLAKVSRLILASILSNPARANA